jgi:hypothetical protein
VAPQLSPRKTDRGTARHRPIDAEDRLRYSFPMPRRHHELAAMLCMLLYLLSCRREPRQSAAVASTAGSNAARPDRIAPTSPAPSPSSDAASAAASVQPTQDAPHQPISEERSISFAFRPAGASQQAYAMQDPLDQHRILLTRGVERGKAYPVVVAMHGQPRRGKAPRSYEFTRVVAEVTRELVDKHEIEPLVLVTPVFRFEGQNWPNFEIGPFMLEVGRILAQTGVGVKGTYVVGHSAAAGCGGAGLNHVAAIAPSAVGFFDTCVGEGFLQAARELAKQRIPTLIAHSVETAGFRPRQRTEYVVDFDFGRVYSTIGLRPSACPEHLPEVPLRRLDYRCATNERATTQALVLDTGSGDEAHEALVPVALRYFLRQYVQSKSPGG